MNNEAFLRSYGIRPTAIRLMIFKCISEFGSAFSFDDISDVLETIDRSTIFRTLNTFENSGLIHKFEDGLGHSKYCLSMSNHVHVSCKCCGKTFCLPIHSHPQFSLPENFQIEEIKYVITGICQDCKA